MRVEVAVVGGGLAGCFTAWELLARGVTLCMIDAPSPGYATPVAAGLYNPLRFRDLAAVGDAASLVNLLRERLAEIAAFSGTQLDNPVGIGRLFGDEPARSRWESLSRSSEVIGPVLEQRELPQALCAPYGAGLTKYSGYVEPELLQRVVHQELRSRRALREQWLASSDLRLRGPDGTIEVGDVQAEAVVLCQGVGAATAPLWPAPSIDTLRGEVLHVRVDGLSLDRPLHRGVYIVPRADGSCVVGSTYQHDNRDLEPTGEARADLLKRLSKLTEERVELLDQRVGLRPISADGEPIVGLLSDNVAIVNGLGPKGMLYAPAAGAIAADALGISARASGNAAALERGRQQANPHAAEQLPTEKLSWRWRPDRHTLDRAG